jgi:hypothetical protein
VAPATITGMDREIGMGEGRTRSPGQWAPWIDDPDPPEPPMTPEEIKAAAKAVKELMDEWTKAKNSSNPPPARTPEERRAHLLNSILRNLRILRVKKPRSCWTTSFSSFRAVSDQVGVAYAAVQPGDLSDHNPRCPRQLDWKQL